MSHYQKAISKQCTKEILEQMEKSFCRIKGQDNQIGFFCHINYKDENVPAIITQNNININENNTINISPKYINSEIKLDDIIYQDKKDQYSTF